MTLNTLGKTTEEVEDIIGSLVVGSGDVNVTYDDTNDQLSIDVSTLTNEEVQDTVASFVNSDSNLSWSYDDTNDTLTVSLSDSISVNTLEAGTFIDGQNNSVTDFTDVGGNIQFVQGTKPLDSESDIGDTWFDTANQVLHIYYTVSSGVTGWVPTNKIVKEEFINDFSATTTPFFTDGSYSNSLSSTGSFSYDLEFLDSASNLSVDVTGKSTNENSYVNKFNTYGFSTTTTTNSNVSNESLTVTGESSKDTNPSIYQADEVGPAPSPSHAAVRNDGGYWDVSSDGIKLYDKYGNTVVDTNTLSTDREGVYSPETERLFAHDDQNQELRIYDVSDLNNLTYNSYSLSYYYVHLEDCTNDGEYLLFRGSSGRVRIYNANTNTEIGGTYPGGEADTYSFNGTETGVYAFGGAADKRGTAYDLNGNEKYTVSYDYRKPLAEVKDNVVICTDTDNTYLIDENENVLDSYSDNYEYNRATWIVTGNGRYAFTTTSPFDTPKLVLFEIDSNNNLIHHGVVQQAYSSSDPLYYFSPNDHSFVNEKGQFYTYQSNTVIYSQAIETFSENVSVNVDSTEVASYDTLASSKSVSGFNIPSNSSVTFSAQQDGEPIDVSFTWDEDIITTDPSVTINGNTTTYNGEVADGTTVTISPNESDLQADSNTVDIDTSLGSITSASYSHDAVASPRSDLNTTVSVDGSNLTASQDGDTVYIEPRLPAGVSTWSLADYFADGGSGVVNVYLQQLTGGTWSRVNSGNPIPQDFDISSLDTTKNLRFEVVFADAATATQTLQFVSRVYTQE